MELKIIPSAIRGTRLQPTLSHDKTCFGKTVRNISPVGIATSAAQAVRSADSGMMFIPRFRIYPPPAKTSMLVNDHPIPA
jgi:hypothetical protein